MLRFPDQAFTVIILSNLAEFHPTRLAEQVADLYLAEDYTSSPVPTKTESVDPIAARTQTEFDISESELNAHSGRYYSGELDATYIFRVVDGKLTYHLEHSPVDIQLVPTGRDEWEADYPSVRFLRNRTGMVDGLSVSSGRIRDIKFKKNRP